MSICFLYKKFRSDLTDTKSSSSTFSFFLHCKMWISEYIFKLDTVAAGFMWTSYPLHQFLHSLNLKGKNVLEFGSGGSTVFFLQRKANLVTFEHSEVWIEKLKPKLQTYDNWKIKLVNYVRREMASNSHEQYLHGLEEVRDNSLDLVLVDGRHRVECIRASIPKVKKNGYIILDDSDRPEYLEAFELLQEWESSVVSGFAYMSDFKTHPVVWKKP